MNHKSSLAWQCVSCGDVTLSYRGTRLAECPNCKGAQWKPVTVHRPTKAANTGEGE